MQTEDSLKQPILALGYTMQLFKAKFSFLILFFSIVLLNIHIVCVCLGHRLIAKSEDSGIYRKLKVRGKTATESFFWLFHVHT